MSSKMYIRTVLALAASLFVLVSSAAQEKIHEVVRGDTLYSIGRTYKVEISALKKENHLSNNPVLSVGQKLTIPSTQLSPPSANVSVTENKSPSFEIYTVKKGDTLYGIARSTKISVTQIQVDNSLSPSANLKVGQNLRIRRLVGALVAQDLASTNTNPPAVLPSTTTTIAEKIETSTGTQGSDLSGHVSAGTSFQTNAYTLGSKFTWPHSGERRSMNGKLPGILIKASKNDPVKAVSGGKVVYSGPHATFGHIVFIQSSDGFIYIYGGNESSSMKTGDTVQTGDTVGTVGITPGILEPQVYFSVWKDGSYVDPSSVLKN